MEIISPHILWKEYDRSSLPLNVSEISRAENEKYEILNVYFNGFSVVDGTIRVFAKLYTPKIKKNNAILYIRDVNENSESVLENVNKYIFEGYSVLVPDLYGDDNKTTRFTIYPNSHRFAIYEEIKNNLFTIPSNLRLSCWYVWQVVTLRSLTYLIELGFDINNIGIIGKGIGGAQALKMAAIEEKIAFGVSIFNPHLFENATNNDFIAYKTALDCTGYTANIKVPFLFQTASNDADGSLDKISELCENTKITLSIAERNNENLNEYQRNNMLFFVKRVFNDEIIPKVPLVNIRGSQEGLYYEIKTFDSEIKEVELFISQAILNPAYRNWHSEKLDKSGENTYLTKVAVFEPEKPVYAFVNIKFSDGFKLSSSVMTRIPHSLGVKAAEINLSRLIYDSELGVDDWLDLKHGGELKVKSDLLGIEGIGSSTYHMSTFKLGEYRYKGGDDDVLQLLICTETMQTLFFNVTEKDGSKYEFESKIQSNKVWSKLNLMAEGFIGKEHSLSSWTNVVNFEIIGESNYLINSLKWV